MLERSNKQPQGVCSSSRGTEDSKPSPGIARRLRSGTATVLDVRLEDEFAAGHLPDALNIPLSQLERRLAELPPDQEIIAYCRGPWCVLSFEAVALLRHRGYRAATGGRFSGVETAGLPIDSP
jgi:ArsR family transcriptional regulator